MNELVENVVASLITVCLVYLLYAFGSWAQTRGRATAACWWLPGWRCFRLVVRNMGASTPVAAVRYRTWLREERPAIGGSSVKTWVDRELSSGEQLVLPKGEDLTALSFRFEKIGDESFLVITDKLGEEQQRWLLLPQHSRLMIEYSCRFRTFLVLRSEVSRVYELNRYPKPEGRVVDRFKTSLLSSNQKGEAEVSGVEPTDVLDFVSG